jgi:hypothetical protein
MMRNIMVTTNYIVQGWHEERVRVGWLAGVGTFKRQPSDLFIVIIGSKQPPAPPAPCSRGDLYRWLADLEDQGFSTRSSDREPLTC